MANIPNSRRYQTSGLKSVSHGYGSHRTSQEPQPRQQEGSGGFAWIWLLVACVILVKFPVASLIVIGIIILLIILSVRG